VIQSTSLPPCSSLPRHGTSAPASRARSCRLLCFQLLPQPGQIHRGHAAIHRFLRHRAPPRPRGAPHSRTLARHPSELPPHRPLAPLSTVLATTTAVGELPPPVPFSRGGPACRALVLPHRPRRAPRCRPPRRQGPAAAAGAPPEAGRGDDVLAGALRGGGARERVPNDCPEPNRSCPIERTPPLTTASSRPRAARPREPMATWGRVRPCWPPSSHVLLGCGLRTQPPQLGPHIPPMPVASSRAPWLSAPAASLRGSMGACRRRPSPNAQRPLPSAARPPRAVRPAFAAL
jgi:hypothetical protein